MKTINIDGKTYKLVEINPTDRNRHVVVVDRGWLWVGDMTRDKGRILLDNAKNLFNFRSIGFTGVLDNPKSENVDLRPISQIVDIPECSELFSIKVDDNWDL